MSAHPMPPLRDARWPQVEAAHRDVLILPLGSMEQHGPHLPLDTDAFIADAVARRLHGIHPQAGLAPVLRLGASDEHAAFPGTLSIGTDALTHLLRELVRRASRWWRAVLIVNGHGGNVDALRQVRDVCGREGMPIVVHHLTVPGGDAHAGRTETSLMLHLDPARVRYDLAEPGETTPIVELMPRLRADGVRAVSGNGVLGDPAGASAERGAELFTYLVERADAALTGLLTAVGGGSTA
ncbi:mycofactocin biosynthesis peptidyl-dipeptidase MftE [Dactylosporangium sp. NPDC000555]|uniref:mycofactocin biosynthesis peptidyl-dipeptidase MftE n=1 Tax=Dactylosporangium sp. NPDC000555 TaxID=3154260 RepID=UPI00332ECC5A